MSGGVEADDAIARAAAGECRHAVLALATANGDKVTVLLTADSQIHKFDMTRRVAATFLGALAAAVVTDPASRETSG